MWVTFNIIQTIVIYLIYPINLNVVDGLVICTVNVYIDPPSTLKNDVLFCNLSIYFYHLLGGCLEGQSVYNQPHWPSDDIQECHFLSRVRLVKQDPSAAAQSWGLATSLAARQVGLANASLCDDFNVSQGLAK